ncbi:hypothetical protein [Citricoccus sp. GCM10030269]|uniref:hypothetical protein n=1 Tax=Citricoccus sp. GCM10030269 TaxID=3273388 RepID=UPI0036096A07
MTTRSDRQLRSAPSGVGKDVLTVGAALACALALAGCSDGTQTDHGGATDPSSSVADDGRPDQQAAASAANRAGSFGFTNQAAATQEAIVESRDEARRRQSNTTGTTVEPADCASPLTAIDWSPILMPDAEASRVDFGSETFAGTGTVEVASLEDAEVVRDHMRSVDQLVAECPELSLTVADSSVQGSSSSASSDSSSSSSVYDVTARASEADADSALVWTRTPAGGQSGGAENGAEDEAEGGNEGQTTVQVLMDQTDDYVVMVSFIGGSEVAGEEFTTMAEEILATAVDAL